MHINLPTWRTLFRVALLPVMVVVFCSFLATPDVSVKQIGLGLAVAVLIDATVVRLVLVPALMEMLGRANWWLPGRFHRNDPRDQPGATAPALLAARISPVSGSGRRD